MNSKRKISSGTKLSISQAANFLDVSPKTLRRWEKAGLLSPTRNNKNQRVYSVSSLIPLAERKYQPLPKNENLNKTKNLQTQNSALTISEAAQELEVSQKSLRRWDEQGLITSERNELNHRIFSINEINRVKRARLNGTFGITAPEQTPTLEPEKNTAIIAEKPLSPLLVNASRKFDYHRLKPAAFGVLAASLFLTALLATNQFLPNTSTNLAYANHSNSNKGIFTQILGITTSLGNNLNFKNIIDSNFNFGVAGTIEGNQIISSTNSKAPLIVSSSQRVANLNADLLDGKHLSEIEALIGSSGSLQAAYEAGNQISTDTVDLVFNLSDQSSDADFKINILGNTSTFDINGNSGESIVLVNPTASYPVNISKNTRISGTISLNGPVLATSTLTFDDANTPSSVPLSDAANTTLPAGYASILDVLADVGTPTSGLFTDGGTVTYRTDTSDDFAIGGSGLSAALAVDVSENKVRIGNSSGSDGRIELFASDGDSGIISVNTSDEFNFSGANVVIAQDLRVGGSDIFGSNSESINIGGTDDIIAFVGSGGTDNTDLYVNLDGAYPVLYSNTDTAIGLDDDLIFVGAQTISTTTGNLTLSPAGSFVVSSLNCSGNANGGALTANASGVITCSDDDAGNSIAAEENDISVSTTVSTFDFLGNDFTLSESPAGEVNVSIDYANSAIARTNQGESITGAWTFTNGLTLSGSDINLAGNNLVTSGATLSAAELNLLDSGILLSELTDSGTLTAGSVDINGGAIDGTIIGAGSASAGTFTNLTATGNTIIGNANTDLLTINAGTSGSGIRFTDGTFASCTALETDISGNIVCGTDDTGSSGAAVQENDVTVTASATTFDFLGNDFIVTDSPAGEANIAIDYANSFITRTNQNETISGTWTFSNELSVGTLTLGAQSFTSLTGTGLSFSGGNLNVDATEIATLLSAWDQNASDDLTTGNYSGTLDDVYVNVGEAPSAGDITGSFSGGLFVGANSVALGTDTTGNYIDNVTGGDGITVTGSAGEGWDPDIAIDLIDTNSGLAFVAGELGLRQDCNLNELLAWNGSGWVCATDQTGSGAAVIQENDVTVVGSLATLDFNGTDFTVADEGSGEAGITIDYASSGITRSGVSQTISAPWTFNGGATFANLTLNSETFSDLTGNGLAISAGQLELASSVAGDGLTYSSGILAVGAGTGITVNANDIAIDTSATLSWSGTQNFTNIAVSGETSTGTLIVSGEATINDLYVTNNIALGGTVDGRDIAADGANLDNLYTTIGLASLTSVEVDQLENIDSVTISNAQWGYLGALNQALATTDSVTFDALSVTNNASVGTLSINSETFSTLTGTGLSIAGGSLNIDSTEIATLLSAWDQNASDDLTTGNYATTLDDIYVNVGESPTGGDISGNFSSGLNIGANVIDFTEITNSLNLDGTTTITAGIGESLNLTKAFTDATSETGLTFGFSGSDSTSSTTAQYGLYLDNLASTEGLDGLLVLDNSDTDDAVAAAIRIINAGGGFTNLFDINGTGITTSEFTVLSGGIALGSETTGDYVASFTAGNGISGDASGEGSTPSLAIDLLGTTDGTGATSSNSGLEFAGASSDQLALIQGCSDGNVLKWIDATNSWDCASDNTGGAASSLSWDDLLDPDANESLNMNEYTTAFNWNTADTAAGFDGFTFSITNDATTDASTQELLTLTNADAAGSSNTEVLLRIENLDTDEAVSNGLIITSAAGGINTAIDLSDAEIVTALSLGANDITATNFSITGSSGDITTAGVLNINGDFINSDGNLTLAATGYVRIGDTGTPGNATTDDDLYVEGDIEADGTFYGNGGGLTNLSTSALSGTLFNTAGNSGTSAIGQGDLVTILGGTNLTSIDNTSGTITINLDDSISLAGTLTLNSETFSDLTGNGLAISAGQLELASSVAGDGLTYSSGILAVGAGTGITVNANDIAIDTSATLSWSGTQNFTNIAVSGETSTGSLIVSGEATINDLYVTNNIALGGTVDGRDIAADGSNLDNLYTTIGLSALTSGEVDQLENIDSVTISNAQWGYLGALNQALATTDSVTFDALSVTNNASVGTLSINSETFSTLTGTGLSIAGGSLNIDSTEIATLLSAWDQNASDDLTTGNYATTLDDIYVNVGESPTGGDISGNFSSGLNIGADVIDFDNIADALTLDANTTISAFGGANTLTIANGLNLSVQGSLTVGSDSFSDLTGNGLALSGNTLAIDLLGSADGAGASTNNSGLEFGPAGELALLQGCSDNQILKWSEGASTWSCSNDVSGAGSIGLDDAYNVGGTITVDAYDVAFNLNNATNDYGLVIDNTTTGEIAIGLEFSTTGSGATFATAIDLSDADIVTALALGSNDVTVGGVTIESSEFALLNGRNGALVDTDDAVATSITGTGALNAGSITSGFGSINLGTDNFTTTGTASVGFLTINSETFSDLTGNGLAISAGQLELASSVAGDGLTYSSGILAVGAGTGITVNANDIAIDTSATLSWSGTQNFTNIAVSGETSTGTLTINSESFTNLTGAGLAINSGILNIDSTEIATLLSAWDQNASDDLTTGNYTGTLDDVYVNVGESPTGGDISGNFSSGLTINADSVDLTTHTTGNYVASFTAGNGLTGDATGEGSTPTLDIDLAANSGLNFATNQLTIDLDTNSGLSLNAGGLALASGVSGNGLTLNSGVLNIGEGTGISVGADAISIDTTDSLSWSGTQNFTNVAVSGEGSFGSLNVTGGTVLGLDSSDTLTINAGSSGTGISFGDSSFANCTALETVGGVLTCGSDATGTSSLQDAYNTGQTIDLNLADLALDLSDATNDYGIVIDNTSTGTIATALEFSTTGVGSAFTTAIDISDAGITNALSLGGNTILGTTTTIDFTNFDVAGSTGNTTIGGTLSVNGASTFNAGQTTGDVTIYGTGSTPMFFSDSSTGRIGINTISPAAEFEISGASQTELVIDAPSNFNAEIVFQEGGSDVWTLSSNGVGASNTFSFTEAGGTALRLFSETSIGVGVNATTEDAELFLSVDQDALTELRIDNTNSTTSITHTALTLYDGGSARARYGYNNNTLLLTSGNIANGDYAFMTNNTEQARLLSTGAFGLGDTSADAKLEVLSTTEQLRLTHTDNTSDARFSVSSTGDLTLDLLGSGSVDQLILADTDVLNIGGSANTDVAYNIISDSATANVASTDNDLFIEGILEVDGEIEVDGTLDVDGSADFSNGLTVSSGNLSVTNNANVGTLTLNSETFSDLTGSGLALSSGALTVTGLTSSNITADSLNFTEFSDTLSLDAATSIALGSNNFTFNLDSTGNFAIQDNGSSVLGVSNTGSLDIYGPTAFFFAQAGADNKNVYIENLNFSGSTNLLDLALQTATSIGNVDGLEIAFTNADDANVETHRGLYINMSNEANTADDTLYGLQIDNANNGISDATQVTDRLLVLNNADTNDVVPTGLQFLSSGGGFTNFIDTPSSVFQVTGAGNLTAAAATINGNITLANGEAISNVSDGTIAFTDGTNTLLSISDEGTYGFLQHTVIGQTPATCTEGAMYANDNGNLYYCESANTWVDLTAAGGSGSSAWDDLTAPDANLSLNLGSFTSTFTSTATTTNPWTFNFDSLTTGTAFDLSVDALTSGNGLNITSTSTALTSGSLLSLDWSASGTNTSTADLFSLNIGANDSVSSLLNITDNGSTVFKVTQNKITSGVPHEFTATGDVAIAYDLVFTNQTAGTLKSDGPLTIESGESFESQNLTLKTYNAGDVVISNESSTAAVTFDADGSVAIGDTTTIASANVPDGSLVISNGILCVDNTGNNCDDSARTAGTIYANNATVSGLDLAETYPSVEILEAGDVVMIDPTNAEHVKRSTSGYQASAIGVISTKPGFLLGGFDSKDYNGATLYPVALSGRVPVKVTAANGPIQAGDPITASNIAGVGMKSTQPGQVVARAMEDYNPSNPNDVATIEAFIETGYHDPNLAINEIGNLDNRLHTAEANIASLNTQVTQLQNQLNTTNSTVANLESTVTNFENKFRTNRLGVNIAAPATDSGKLIDTSSGAFLSDGGVWTNVSDVSKKENFQSVDTDVILEGITNLDISTWNYIAENDSVRHIGPTAQDFYSVFGFGANNKSISTIDPAGIALAGIKGLNTKVETMHAQIAVESNAAKTERISMLDQIKNLVANVSNLQNQVSQLAQNQTPNYESPLISSDSVTTKKVTTTAVETYDIAATNATFGDLVADTIKVSTISAETIEGLDEKIDSKVNGRMAILESKLAEFEAAQKTLAQAPTPTPTATPVPVDPELEATLENIDSLLDTSVEFDQDEVEVNLDTETDIASNLFADYDGIFVNDFLAVNGTASIVNAEITNMALVNNNLLIEGNSISVLDDQTLFIQPQGGKLNLLAGLLTLDSNGSAVINGDLLVTGTLAARDIRSSKLEFGAILGEATASAVKAEYGDSEASRSGSKAALALNSNDQLELTLATNSALVITPQATDSASLAQSKPSAQITASGEAEFATLKLNQSSGEVKVAAGSQGVIVETNKLSADSQVIVTFQGDYSPATRYWVVKDASKGTFTINLDKPVGTGVSAYWLIIN